MYDPEAATSELVRHLRGERSQEALNRRLRYASNVTYQWEAGRRYPTAAGLFWLAHRTGIDLTEAFADFGVSWSEQSAEPWTVEGAASLMRDLHANQAVLDVATHLDLSRHKVGRWLRGEAEPRFPDFLRMVEYWTARSTDFLACLCDPAELPSVAETWARRERARARMGEHPWAAAVQLALELERYRALPAHEDGWIAAQLRIDPEVERACLELLAEAGDIKLRKGRYEPVQIPRINLQGSEERLRTRRFWSDVAMANGFDGPDCRGGWNLVTVSREDFTRIKRLQRDYYVGIRNVVEDSDSQEVLVLITMQAQVLAE